VCVMRYMALCFVALLAGVSAEETPLLGVAVPEDAVLITPHRVETIATGLHVPWELVFFRTGGFCRRSARGGCG
jgi:hypothetical protein